MFISRPAAEILSFRNDSLFEKYPLLSKIREVVCGYWESEYREVDFASNDLYDNGLDNARFWATKTSERCPCVVSILQNLSGNLSVINPDTKYVYGLIRMDCVAFPINHFIGFIAEPDKSELFAFSPANMVNGKEPLMSLDEIRKRLPKYKRKLYQRLTDVVRINYSGDLYSLDDKSVRKLFSVLTNIDGGSIRRISMTDDKHKILNLISGTLKEEVVRL